MRLLPTFLLLLSACTTQKVMYLPDGRQGYAIECSGTAQTWNECYTRAGEICKGSGYEVLSKNGEQGQVISGSQYAVFGGTVQKRAMVIACKSLL